MASATQQRLRRARIANQPSLDLQLPAQLDLSSPQAAQVEQDVFAGLARQLEASHASTPDPWAGSPYAWFKHLPPGRRASTGIVLLSRWLTHCGISHEPRHGTAEHDLTVTTPTGPQLVQVRVSTLWAEGEFRFQGIKAGRYDKLALLAVAPLQVMLWVAPQHEALANLDTTGWLTVPQHRIPPWLASHGGTLTAGTAELVA